MSETTNPMTVTFGTDSYQNVVGIVQSEKETTQAEVAEARDEEGKVFAMKAYSKTSMRTIDALFAAGTTPPEAGALLTLGEWKGIVTEATVKRSNKEFATISITAVCKDSASAMQVI